ncbi:YihY/virulence factor BrkB family protein [Georgenia thermotolerans]|uniref:YihY family inner membrane protein n=1 Tax=Georgenia thermotolerans TaxID=527326 RepID=A0A7J5UJI6_9MICO|nr:YihY/virulence factor BrkB family protein [Georgenia thermotolerans]KAE8762538.1 YihY family inner membrane protein [Georgenia thermotolerans]
MATTRQAPHEEHPAKPDSPTEIRKPSWKYVTKRSFREFMDDNCTDLAAGLTYYAVLSLFPAIIALVSILSLVGQAESTTTTLKGMLSDVVPDTTMQTLGPVIDALTNVPAPGAGLVIGLLVALWSASNYVNAFGRAMNRMYEVPEGRPIWKLRPFMYALTAVLLVLVAIAAVLLVVSGPIARAIGDVIGLGDVALTVWNIAKWPALLLVTVVVVALLYHFTPNVKQPKFRWISLGAVIAIVTAALAVLAFGFYASQFGSYSKTYGALAGVIIFLLLLWITNLALLFGAEFDAELERGRELQGGIEAEETLQLPPKDTRASDKKAKKAEEDVERGRELRERFEQEDEPASQRDGRP